MSYAYALLARGIRRVLIWQLIIVVCFAVLGGVIYGYYHLISIFYGGLIAMLVTLILGWRLQKVNISIKSAFSVIHIYIGVIERFILVILGFWIGIKFLALLPFPMIIGFSIAQIGYVSNLPDR